LGRGREEEITGQGRFGRLGQSLRGLGEEVLGNLYPSKDLYLSQSNST